MDESEAKQIGHRRSRRKRIPLPMCPACPRFTKNVVIHLESCKMDSLSGNMLTKMCQTLPDIRNLIKVEKCNCVGQ